MTDVSVIVPVYNVEKYIRPSLDSILVQTHKNIEVILVDDGSKDQSGAICDEYAKEDSRVRVIHKANAGTGRARNDGVDAAKGKYLYFCDPDDLLTPTLIEDNFALAEAEDADIVVFGYETLFMQQDGSLLPKGQPRVPVLNGTFERDAFWRNAYDEICYMNSLWVRLFRRDFIVEHQLRACSMSSGQDSVFLFDVWAAPFRRISFNPKVYYRYILRPASATTGFKKERFENEIIMIKKLRTLLEKMPKDERYDELILSKYMLALERSIKNTVHAGNMNFGEKSAYIKQYLLQADIQEALVKMRFSKMPSFKAKVKLCLLKLRLVPLLTLYYERM